MGIAILTALQRLDSLRHPATCHETPTSSCRWKHGIADGLICGLQGPWLAMDRTMSYIMCLTGPGAYVLHLPCTPSWTCSLHGIVHGWMGVLPRPGTTLDHHHDRHEDRPRRPSLLHLADLPDVRSHQQQHSCRMAYLWVLPRTPPLLHMLCTLSSTGLWDAQMHQHVVFQEIRPRSPLPLWPYGPLTDILDTCHPDDYRPALSHGRDLENLM
jgi:hypothetical protein